MGKKSNGSSRKPRKADVFPKSMSVKSQGGNGVPVKKTKTGKGIKDKKIFHENIAIDWQTTFDAVWEAICLLDRHQKIMRANRAMSEMFGIPNDKLLGRHCWEIVHGTNQPVPNCPITRAMKSCRREEMELSKGEKFFMVTADPILNDRKEIVAIVHIIRDITQAKTLLEKLDLSEKKYRQLVDQSLFGIGISKGNKVIYANAALLRIFGYSSLEEFVQVPLMDHVAPSSRPMIYERMQKREEGKDLPVEFEYSILCRNGEMKTLRARSKDFVWQNEIFSQTVFEDITEQKKIEKEAKEAEEKYREILKYAPVGVYEVDYEKNHLTYVNDVICELIEYSREELLQMNLFDLFTEDSQRTFVERVEKLTRHEKNLPPPEYCLKTKSGKEIWVRLLSEYSYEKGKLKRASGMAFNITDRKLVEKTIRDREELFRKLSVNLPGALYIFERKPDGSYGLPYSSERVKDIFGLTREALAKDFSLILKFILPEDLDAFLKSVETSAQNMTEWTHQMRIQLPGRPIRWILGRSLPEKQPDGSIIWYGFCADITDQKNLEERLRNSEENYRRLFEDHSAVELILDPQTGDILDANHAAVQFYGWSRDEIRKMKIWQINTLPREDIQKEMEKALQRQKIYFEFRHRLADGSIRDVEVYSSTVKINNRNVLHSIIHDATERKKAERALMQSETRYRTLFESSNDALFIMDKDVFMECNPKTLEIFGCTREQIIGQTPYRFSPPVQPDGGDSQEKALEKINAALQGHPQFFEWKHCRYDGTPFDAEVSLKAMKADNRMLIHAVVRDISERKKAQEEIIRLNETLEQRVLDRTAELEGFTYSVSHDLRAPLRIISGFTEAIMEDYYNKLEPQARDFLKRILAATTNMTELVDDMLKLFRIDKTEMDVLNVNLSHLAQSVMNEICQSQPERTVRIDIQKNLEDLADPRLIRIVLENLLGNAWKFTGKKPVAEIQFGRTIINGQNVYFVRDNGVGFEMEYAGKLFAPFQRLHNFEEFPGTGIGLAIVKRIIHRHGGSVWAEAKVDGGATIFFTLS